MSKYEEIKNNVIRDNNNTVIEVQGFKPGDYIVFERSLGAYSDKMFKIKRFYDQTIFGHTRVYIDYQLHHYSGSLPVDDFFFKGFRKANENELK